MSLYHSSHGATRADLKLNAFLVASVISAPCKNHIPLTTAYVFGEICQLLPQCFPPVQIEFLMITLNFSIALWSRIPLKIFGFITVPINFSHSD